MAIAQFYEVQKYFKNNLQNEISNDCLKINMVNIMKLMIPFTPHLSNECLELMGCKNVNTWPTIQKNIDQEIKLAVQINGKTRDILTVKKDLIEKEISRMIMEDSKAKKYIDNKKILKTIFVKNKIINYIISK